MCRGCRRSFRSSGFCSIAGFPSLRRRVLGRIGREYVKAVESFVVEHEIPVVPFQKDDVKEQIAREHFKTAEREGRFGVVMVGVAQERISAWRGWRDGAPDGHPHFEYRRQSILPNNYYFYIRDPDWGLAFIETTAYAPCLEGQVPASALGSAC